LRQVLQELAARRVGRVSDPIDVVHELVRRRKGDFEGTGRVISQVADLRLDQSTCFLQTTRDRDDGVVHRVLSAEEIRERAFDADCFEAVHGGCEVAEERGAAELAVGEDVDAGGPLLAQHLVDGFVLRAAESFVAELAVRVRRAGVDEGRRPQVAADVVGTVADRRRPGRH
jgi:hypothetical protein